jgi:hypothetical protein
MSYDLISETKPRARKAYSCIWCGEAIAVGEVHSHEVSKYEGTFQNHRWHPECWDASQEHGRINMGFDFEPHEFARGTANSKLSQP